VYRVDSRYGHLKAEVTSCTPDDGHVWCPKHFGTIKLHILSHVVGSLPFTMSTMHGHMNIQFTITSFYKIVKYFCSSFGSYKTLFYVEVIEGL
jgi:hypothetical protein